LSSACDSRLSAIGGGRNHIYAVAVKFSREIICEVAAAKTESQITTHILSRPQGNRPNRTILLHENDFGIGNRPESHLVGIVRIRILVRVSRPKPIQRHTHFSLVRVGPTAQRDCSASVSGRHQTVAGDVIVIGVIGHAK
jgi:hypothetical protein